MKKIIMVMAALMLTICINAQTLKDFTIGEYLTDKDSEIQTTVAGIEGVVIAYTLDDGQIFAIAFIPTTDGIGVNRVYKTDLDRLVDGIETNYDVKMKEKYNQFDDIEAYHDADFRFMIMIDYNQFMDPGYKISLYITNKSLQEKYDWQEQNKANSDF